MKRLTVRIDEELLAKLHFVASYYGRTANGQILYLIRMAARDFERNTNAPIPPKTTVRHEE